MTSKLLKKYLSIMTGALMPLTLAACVQDQPTGLVVRDVVFPEAPDCLIKSDASIVMSNGTLDLVHPLATDNTPGANGIPSYKLNLRLRNNLLTKNDQEKLQINEDNMEYQFDSMAINIVGYDICISAPQDDDPYRHCEDIPEALSYFVPSSVYVEPENNAVDSLEVINANQIMEYFGDISTIDQVGTKIIAHVVALGKTQNGKTLQSNEFVFPIKVCAGCRKVSCPTGYDVSFEGACYVWQDAGPSCVESK